MKPETAKFIEQAKSCVGRAEVMLTVELTEDAARLAYFASFHIAQAYVFELTGKTAKSHHGVQTEFFRLTKDNKKVDHELRRFLSRSYEFKTVADYFIGDDATTSAEDAAGAVAVSKLFVTHFTCLLAAILPDS